MIIEIGIAVVIYGLLTVCTARYRYSYNSRTSFVDYWIAELVFGWVMYPFNVVYSIYYVARKLVERAEKEVNRI